MPEGHTVHRLARTFDELFAGAVVSMSSPQGRFAAGAALLDGMRLVRSEAYGKQMFLGFVEPHDRGSAAAADPADAHRWLRVHLGLYGAWTFSGDSTAEVAHAIGAPRRRVGERETTPAVGATYRAADRGCAWEPPPPRGQVRVRIAGEHACADLTGPMACEVVSADEKAAVVARLGPDPLRADADPERFVAAVRRSRSPVGVLLMNQDVLAGVGNIYRAEALFRARLEPMTPGTAVPAQTIREMWQDLSLLMRDGVRIGAIVTTAPEDRAQPRDDASSGIPEPRGAARRRTRQNTDGSPGAVPHDEAFYVYHRDGLPCRRCGTTVALAELAGRTLYWCPGCQVR